MEVKRNQWEAWIYLLPTLVLLAVFTIYPLFRTFFMAFCNDYNYMLDSWSGIGIQNFKDIFRAGSPFFKYLKTTCIITFISVPISIVLSLLIAVGLNSIKKLGKVYQTIFFMPYVTNAIAIGMVFAVMFSGDGGIINMVLEKFGVPQINWLGGKILSGASPTYKYEMIVLLVYIVWHSLPFKILILLSGLQGIDKQYYQAAQIDCASRFTILMRITVPLLSPQLAFLTTTSFIGSFKEYSSVIGVFGPEEGAVGKLYDMRTIVGYIYASIAENDVGRACAAAVVLFIIIMIFTLIKNKLSKVHY